MVRQSDFPVKTDSKAHWSWFSSQAYRQERGVQGGYPAIRVYPVYGKRWFTGRTFLAMTAAFSIYGAWTRPEKERYALEMMVENTERAHAQLPYQEAELHLRYLITAYKRYRYEQECIIDKGHIGLTSQFRKFFYHDDVWRPPYIDVLNHNYVRYGGHPFGSYNYTFAYW